MEKLNKQIKKMFWISMALSIGFPVGIISLILGLVNSLLFVWIPGIVLLVAGFYGTPVAWISYANTRALKNVLIMIDEENLYTTTEIAAQLGKKESEVVSMIRTMINKGYLTGYIFENDTTLVLNNKQKQMKKVKRLGKCQYCGGMMDVVGDFYVCQYCGYKELKDED